LFNLQTGYNPIRKALDCFDCFASYFELIGYFRSLNIDYKDVRLLFFNIKKREILRILTYDEGLRIENT